MSHFSGLRTGTDNSHGVNSPVMVLGSPSENSAFHTSSWWDAFEDFTDDFAREVLL